MAYSDGEIAEALIRLAINKYDFKTTSEQINVPAQTIRRWNRNVSKKSIPEMLDRAIVRMLSVIPDDMSGHDWSIALGILFDKWLLMQGEATSRHESINRTLDDLSRDEYDRVVEEAERIIAEARNG
jgi:hypothetical protein